MNTTPDGIDDGSVLNGHAAVIVMIKAPRAGDVKTRLCPYLTPTEAAELASCFAVDAVIAAIGTGAIVLIAYAPTDGREVLEPLLPDGVEWIPQRGDTLGERMYEAIEEAGSRGYRPVAVIGADSPTLPSGLLQRAFALLSTNGADAVFGPTEDGGYYLIGVRQAEAGLFDTVAWSTASALADTLRNAASLGLRAKLLSTWYDIDTPDDLCRLRIELRTDSTARERAPRTYEWLLSHEDIDNRPYA